MTDIESKEYTGTAYIGVAGTSQVHIEAVTSINRIHKWAGDAGPIFHHATKGFESRQMHIDNFLKSKHDFLLMLDGDQIFPNDTLDRLRHHRLPYVSGLYMFRSSIPRPIWFKWQKDNGFPMLPYYDIPEEGKLVKLGASGWGCILVHRDVIMGVRDLLKGEPEVIEDDMDIHPYDLKRILGAIQMLEQEGGDPSVRAAAVHMLKEEIRPLRYVKDNVGSDLRFPYFAREAGFTLWGDPDVRCGHLIEYAVTPEDLIRIEQSNPQGFETNRQEYTEKAPKAERKRLAAARKEYEQIDVSGLIEQVRAVANV